MFKTFKVVLNNNCYVVFKDNSYHVILNEKNIGHFNLTFVENRILIDYELLEQYRGVGLGTTFYQMIEKYVEANFEYKELILMIRYDNDRSIKIATKNNYKINYDYVEKMAADGEMTMFNPFVKVKK